MNDDDAEHWRRLHDIEVVHRDMRDEVIRYARRRGWIVVAAFAMATLNAVLAGWAYGNWQEHGRDFDLFTFCLNIVSACALALTASATVGAWTLMAITVHRLRCDIDVARADLERRTGTQQTEDAS